MTGAAATTFPFLAAAASEAKEPLIVSLHDVAPATREASEQILAALTRHGVDVCSLLVVPNYHRTGASVEDRSFVRWLQELESGGHEIVLHGYFHERPPGSDETLRRRLMTQIYTANEGEFYDLPYEEAFGRITRGRDELRGAGLTPRGFIAPAWLLGTEARKAAADADLEYTTLLTAIVDLRTDVSFDARSLVYSTRSRARRIASLAWNGTLSYLQRASPLVRLGIHPPDFRHPEVWRHVLRMVDRLATERTPMTYCDWIAEQRLARRD